MSAPQAIARTNAVAAGVTLAPSVGNTPVNSERINDSTLACTPRIVHLTQCHWIKECESDQDVRSLVLDSQLKIAEYLISHPNAIIFDEAPMKRVDSSVQGSCNEDTAIFDKSGPNLINLPDNLKYTLCKQGASHFLGKVNHRHLYRSPQRCAEINQQIKNKLRAGNNLHSAQLRSLVFDQREQELVKGVSQFLGTSKEKNPEIVLIYGANHDFRKYFAGQNFTQIDMT